MILGDAVSKLQTFVSWILNHISRFIAWSLLTPKASNLVIKLDQSQHDLSCGSVSLLIC